MSNTRDKILELFRGRPDYFISGADVCLELGISRTAVWKHISQLRENGYVIEAIPSRGYKLKSLPDVLYPAEVTSGLETRCVGCEVVYFDQTDSTNTQARLLADAGAVEGTVVIADTQGSGKGRLGRSWYSPPEVNLYLSVILRPTISPRIATQMTFLSAVAVAQAIEASGQFSPQLKWPNDVLLTGNKVAGLLNELNAETEQIHYLVLGIGINLNMTADQFPQDLRCPATSLLLEGGQPVSRRQFTQSLLQSIDSLYTSYLKNGFGPLKTEWERRCNVINQWVEVDCQSHKQVGQVSGVDETGALLLSLSGGVTQRVLAGDIRLLNRGA
jgi:BirA family biotin operon repressor/biotin-[acetyl-CoA-carboxylase] ligase